MEVFFFTAVAFDFLYIFKEGIALLPTLCKQSLHIFEEKGPPSSIFRTLAQNPGGGKSSVGP